MVKNRPKGKWNKKESAEIDAHKNGQQIFRPEWYGNYMEKEYNLLRNFHGMFESPCGLKIICITHFKEKQRRKSI